MGSGAMTSGKRWRSAWMRAGAVSCAVSCVLAGGCETMSEPVMGGGGTPNTAWSSGPFAPTRLVLHPLTHYEGPDGGRGAIIVCHLEFQDRWGDTVKGAGKLTVELYRPLGGPGQPARQELSWEVDLADLEINAAMYDPVTRTYRVQLGGLPGWVGDELAGEDASGLGVLLRARFSEIGGALLQGERTVRR